MFTTDLCDLVIASNDCSLRRQGSWVQGAPAMPLALSRASSSTMDAPCPRGVVAFSLSPRPSPRLLHRQASQGMK